jgi:hypothetical protein
MATVTPKYSWPVPTSTDYVADGAVAIEALGDAIDTTLGTALGGAYPGLRLIKKQTIGTGVSSVTVTDAFSATYDSYKIIVSGGIGSVAGGASLGLRLGATSTGYYAGLTGVAFTSGTSVIAGENNLARFVNLGYAVPNSLSLSCELTNPFATQNTYVSGSPVSAIVAGGYYAAFYSGFLNDSTSYTDFTLIPSSGTITGGTIYVYGYGAS